MRGHRPRFWEKINGSPKEKSEKKQKDDESWAEMRRNRELRKQAKQQRKSRT